MAHLKKGPGNHLLKNASGHLVKACAAANPCSYCPGGVSPNSFSVSFTGIFDCVSCTINDSGIRWHKISPAVNGSFTLYPSQEDEDNPTVITECMWSYPQQTWAGFAFEEKSYTNSSCITETGSPDFFSIFLQRVSATQWQLVIGRFLEDPEPLFSDLITVASDSSCRGPFNFTNDVSEGDYDSGASGNSPCGGDGTAVVTGA